MVFLDNVRFELTDKTQNSLYVGKDKKCGKMFYFMVYV